MAKRKVCSNCGYHSSENDLKCPVCGGHMGGEAYYTPHNSEVEHELNNGYHNDFEEGNKTGDYCDRDLELNTNGGQHYHNDQQAETAFEILNNAKPVYEMEKKEVLKIQAILSIFPIIGLLYLIYSIKQFDEYGMDDYKRSSIAVFFTIKFIMFMFVFSNDIFNFIF